MKRFTNHHVLILVAVAVVALAFGVNSAFASQLIFDHKTGIYSFNATADDSRHYDVKVHRAGSVGFTSWTVIEWNKFEVGDAFWSQDVATYCFHDGDHIACPAAKVRIFTADGDDSISGASDLSVSTELHGGKGVDTIHAGGGPDLLDGEQGADQLYGGGGTDLADYSRRAEFINASLDVRANDGASGELDFIHSDVEGIQGGSGDDILYGNGSGNVLKGGPGDDYLSAGDGADLLNGQEGSDLLRGGYGADAIYGGTDLASFCCSIDTATWSERSNPIMASIDGFSNDGEAGEGDYVGSDVEGLFGGPGDDTLTGDNRGNRLTGGIGSDTLNGKGGGSVDGHPELLMPDQLLGGSDADVLDGGPASTLADTLDGGTGTDMVTYASRTAGVEIHLDGTTGGEDQISNVENTKGGEGNDLILGSADANWIFSDSGSDALFGQGGSDILHGGDDSDTLYGNAGADVVSGDIGNDTLSGGEGGDFISGSDGLDTATYANYTVPVTVSLDDDLYNDGAAGEGDKVLADVETVVGGTAADSITGSAAPNTLVGGDGPDTLTGRGGADLLQGGAKNDILQGADDSDTLEGGSEEDTLYGGDGYDTLRGDGHADELHGGAGLDTADYSAATSAVSVDLAANKSSGQGADVFDAVENIFGSNYADVLKGNGGPNVLRGNAGIDKLFGLAGNDKLDGGLDIDSLDGGLDTDSCLNGETLVSCE